MSQRKKPPTSHNGFTFDADEADRKAAWFANYLLHTKGEWAGKPFILDPWQRDEIVRPLFGWKRPDGTRRYRTVYVEIPKKNGKSAFCAGLALLMLCGDNEPGAEIYSAAADRDQARIVFDTAKQMAIESPAISKRVKVYRSAIEYQSNHSVYRVISADAHTKHGFNAHGVIFDELHTQPTRELWDTLTMGVVARRQPVIIAITNSGHDRESICYEQHQYAAKVLEGTIPDDSFLPILYNAPDDCDPYDEAVWAAVNPGLGRMVKIEHLRTEALQAKHSIAYLNTFRQLHLGQWTERISRWLDLDAWHECGGAIVEADLEGRDCYGGLDLSTTTDITAFVLVFPPRTGEKEWHLISRFWVPEEGVTKRSQRDRVPYDAWAHAGWIKATDGNVVDYDVVRADILALAKRFNIRQIPRDRWNSTQISTQLMGDGLDVIDFGQGYASMSAPSKHFEGLVTDRTLRHGDNPVLTWMASNVAIQTDAAGNIKPTKEKSQKLRIDGIVAAIMGVGQAIKQDTGEVKIWSITA